MTDLPTNPNPLRERVNVALLAFSQALFLIAAVTVMTLSALAWLSLREGNPKAEVGQ